MADALDDILLEAKLRDGFAAQQGSEAIASAKMGDPSVWLNGLLHKLNILQQDIRQGAAGTISMVAPSPTSTGLNSYTPAGLEGMYGGISALSSFAGGPKLPGAEIADADMLAAIARADNITGAIPREMANQEQNMWRLAGETAVPGPKVPASVPAALRVATELLVPLNQMRGAGGTALSFGVPLIAEKVVHGEMEDAVKKLETVSTSAEPSNDSLAAFSATPPQTSSLDDIVSILNSHTTDPLTASINAHDPVAAINAGVVSPADIDEHEHESKLNASTIALGGLAVLGAYGLGAGVRQAMRAKLQQTTALSGLKAVEPSTIGEGSRTYSAIFDANTPVYRTAKNAGAVEKDVDTIRDAMGNANTQSVAAKTNDFWVTGELPFSAVNAPKMASHMEELASLGPDKWKAYDDALTGMNKYQQMIAENKFDWDGVTRTDALMHYNTARQDPQLAHLLDEVHEYYGAMRNYWHDKGMISSDTLRDWNSKYRYYVPNAINFADDPMHGIMKTVAPNAASDIENMLKRGAIEDGVAVGEGVRPSMLHQMYAHQMIRAAEENTAKLTYVDEMLSHTRQSLVKQVPKELDNTIAVMRNGSREFYKVDPAVAATFNAAPRVMSPVLKAMNMVRSVMSEGTTGRLAPGFVVKSVPYELITGALSRDSKNGLGLATEIMNRAGAPKPLVETFNRLFAVADPTQLLSPFTGAVRGIYSDMAKNVAMSMENSLRSGNGTLMKMLGPQGVQAIADVAGAQYAQSMKRLMMTHGGGNAGVTEHWLRNRDMPNPYATNPEFAKMVEKGVGQGMMNAVKVSTLTRYYTALLDNIHNGTRLQHFASNFRKDMNQADITRLAGQTRRLTGDFTEKGTANVGGIGFAKSVGSAVELANDTVPWVNVGLQSMRSTARAFKRDPVGLVSRVTALTGIGLATVAAQMDDPAARFHFWNTMTANQRESTIPIYGADGEVKFQVALPQEARLWWSPVLEAFGALSGLKQYDALPPGVGAKFMEAINHIFDHSWSEKETKDVVEGSKQAVKDANPFGMPPVVNAGIALAGVDPKSMGLAGRFGGDNSGAHLIREENLSGDHSGRVPGRIVSAQIEAALGELMGSLGPAVIDALDAANRVKDKRGVTPDDLAAIAAKNFALGGSGGDRMQAAGLNSFGWEGRVSTGTTEQKLVSEKMKALKELSTFESNAIKGPNPGHKPQMGTEPNPYYKADSQADTELGKVAAMVRPLNNHITRIYRPQLQALYDQLASIPADTQHGFAQDPVARRKEENTVRQRIRAINSEMYSMIADYEDEIGQILGKPNFRLNTFDIAKAKKTQMP